jgi:hypothetical protein
MGLVGRRSRVADMQYVKGWMVITGPILTGGVDVDVEGAYNITTGQLFLVGFPRGGHPTAVDFAGPGASPSGLIPSANDIVDDLVALSLKLKFDHDVRFDTGGGGYSPPKPARFGWENSLPESTSESRLTSRCLYKIYALVNVTHRSGQGGSSSSSSGSSSSGSKSKYRSDPDFSDLDPEATPASPAGDPQQDWMPRDSGIINITGVMFSPDCGGKAYAFAAEGVRIEVIIDKISSYLRMVIVLTALQIWVLMGLSADVATQGGAAKVSPYTVGMMALLDAYLCLIHLTGAQILGYAGSGVMAVVILKFVAFSVFELRILMLAWKARRTDVADHMYPIAVYCRFYLVLGTTFFLIIYAVSYIGVVITCFYMFWLPQIVHNAVYRIKRPLRPRFILVMSTTRLAIPLYHSLCPQNYLNLLVHSGTFPVFGWTLLGLVAAETAVLLAQHYKGPRCFLPSKFFPPAYSYYQRVPERDLEDATGEVTCAICMDSISDEDQRAGSVLVTPCNHLYHAPCLEQWMDIKLECPTCRAPLPPLE